MIACNEAGPGQPSKPSVPITAGVMKYKPGPPEGLNPDRVTKSSVALSWRPPKDDGGSKIVGYIVEMKHKDEKEFHDLGSVQQSHLSFKFAFQCFNLPQLEKVYPFISICISIFNFEVFKMGSNRKWQSSSFGP